MGKIDCRRYGRAVGGRQRKEIRKRPLCFFSVFLLAVLVCLSGCGKKPQNENAQNTQTPEPEPAESDGQSEAAKEDQGQDVDADADRSTDVSVKEDAAEKDSAANETGEEKDSAANGTEEEEESEQTPLLVKDGVITVSIVGDSVSTFTSYTPVGYYDYYPEYGAIQSVDETWWQMVIDEFEMELYVNASSAGSTCTGDSTGTEDPQCGCNEFRTDALYGPKGECPDVILVYMGINDFLNSVPLGDNDGTREVEEGEIDNFADAYTLMLDKLQAKYEDAIICCFTLPQIGNYGTVVPYVQFVNDDGYRIIHYDACIKRIAQNKGCQVIDLYDCGIRVDNLHFMTSDGVHPTQEGMMFILQAVRGRFEKMLAGSDADNENTAENR